VIRKSVGGSLVFVYVGRSLPLACKNESPEGDAAAMDFRVYLDVCWGATWYGSSAAHLKAEEQLASWSCWSRRRCDVDGETRAPTSYERLPTSVLVVVVDSHNVWQALRPDATFEAVCDDPAPSAASEGAGEYQVHHETGIFVTRFRHSLV
jgi:hypothetical protein